MTKYTMHIEESRSWWRGTSTTLCGLTLRVERASYFAGTTCPDCKRLKKAARQARKRGRR